MPRCGHTDGILRPANEKEFCPESLGGLSSRTVKRPKQFGELIHSSLDLLNGRPLTYHADYSLYHIEEPRDERFVARQTANQSKCRLFHGRFPARKATLHIVLNRQVAQHHRSRHGDPPSIGHTQKQTGASLIALPYSMSFVAGNGMCRKLCQSALADWRRDQGIEQFLQRRHEWTLAAARRLLLNYPLL
jgi:hypothetical protein